MQHVGLSSQGVIRSWRLQKMTKGVEVNLFVQIRLILEAKFGDDLI